MYPPLLTTPPAIGDSGVVTVAEAKAHCRIDDDDSDALLQVFIDSAVAELDGYSGILDGRCLLAQTWRQVFDCPKQILRLPLKPVSAITSIIVTDSAGGTSAIDSANFRLQRDALGFFVRFNDTYSLPSDLAETEAVAVSFVAGFGTTAAEVPADIRVAILMLVAHRFANREAVNVGNIVTEFPLGVEMLLDKYKRHLS